MSDKTVDFEHGYLDGYEAGVRDTEARYARLVEAARFALDCAEGRERDYFGKLEPRLRQALREIEGEKSCT